ncbi:MAG: M42 family metallopeptidase [Chitinophagales bacterium]
MLLAERLVSLADLPGVSSREGAVRDFLRAEVSSYVDETRTDALGNLICLKKARDGQEGPRVMLHGHSDEVGLMVTRIEKSGLLRFRPVGGVDKRVVVSKVVYVGPDRVPGVIGGKPIHLQEPDEQKKPFPFDKLYIDLGVGDAEAAAKLVRLGDLAVFATESGPLGAGMMKGKAFDDRVGCAIVAELLKDRYSFPLYGVFAVQEEVGMRGAATAAFGIEPALAIGFEGTTASDVPGSPSHLQSTSVGHGPAVTVMDSSLLTRPALLQRILEVAERKRLPLQLRRMNTGATDAGRVALTRQGVLSVTISVPTRYIHSPVSALKLSDLEAAVDLARAVLTSIEEEGLPL